MICIDKSTAIVKCINLHAGTGHWSLDTGEPGGGQAGLTTAGDINTTVSVLVSAAATGKLSSW